MSGKGDTQRPSQVPKPVRDANWERTFGKRERLAIHPVTGYAYWRDPAKPHERGRVFPAGDGALRAGVEESASPDGPWTECRPATIGDLLSLRDTE